VGEWFFLWGKKYCPVCRSHIQFLLRIFDNAVINHRQTSGPLINVTEVSNPYAGDAQQLKDARINDNAFNLCKTRPLKDTLYIRNNYKKYQGVRAIRCRDENNFLEQMLTNIKHERYFLSASDSCSTITEYYHKCKTSAPESEHDKFILITSESPFKITDATEQFKNKYI
jgi:hypothetical protein